MTLTVTQDNKAFEVSLAPSTLLVFVDETGNDSLRDPKYPIFGFGALALQAEVYCNSLREAWLQMKDVAFSGRNMELHACDLRPPTGAQIENLNAFFRCHNFARISRIFTIDTALKDVDTLVCFSEGLKKCIEKQARLTSCTSVALVFEHSDNLLSRIEPYFRNCEFAIPRSEGRVCRVPLSCYSMDKTLKESGLEIADFIAHAAGTAVRDRLNGKISTSGQRPDIAAIFVMPENSWSDFLEIKSVWKSSSDEAQLDS